MPASSQSVVKLTALIKDEETDMSHLMDKYTLQAVHTGLMVYQAIQQEISVLEKSAFEDINLTQSFKILQTITGIGKILG